MPYKNYEDKKRNDARPENRAKAIARACKWAKENKEKVNNRSKEHYHRNKKRRKEIMDKWLSKNKDRRKSISMLSNYGITLDVYNMLFHEQLGCCAICECHQSELKRALHIDHCHKTGIIRGLICQHCNTAIGLLEENRDIILRASEYVKEVTEKPKWQIRLAKNKKPRKR